MRFGVLWMALLVVGCKGDPEPIIDVDGDGFGTAEDCDDNDSAINPNAAESCNAIDDNCDGEIDEGLDEVYYRDNDGDGFGDNSDSIETCERPAGFTTQGEDCDDASPQVFPGNIELCDPIDHDCDGDPLEGATGGANHFRDADGDGYGDPSVAQFSCEVPTGFIDNNLDCNDADPDVSPEAEEVCATPYDDDCDGQNNELPTADSQPFAVDLDGDGFGDLAVTAEACTVNDSVDVDGDGIVDGVTVDNNTDCNDADVAINPGAPELCDGVDNDCNPGTMDDDGPEAVAWWVDADGDGSGDSTTSLSACEVPDGYASASVTEDCDDADPTISPTAVELCDGIDNNCDTLIDDGSAVDAVGYFIDADGDTFGSAFAPVLRACDVPVGYVDNDFDCDDQDQGIGAPPPVYADSDLDGYGDPAMQEFSCVVLDGFVSNDEDCDDDDFNRNPETVWFEDTDGDGFGDELSSLAQCEQPANYSNLAGDCDDTFAGTNPEAPDVCDGVDNDCDLMLDEDCTVEHCGFITAGEVWATDSIHIVTCDIDIGGPGGPVVVIEPGAEVRVDPGVTISAGNGFPGGLQVAGVTFRSSDIDNPQPWGGIELGRSEVPGADSSLVNTTVLHAGSQGFGIRIDDVPVTLDGVIIDGVQGNGLLIEGAASLNIDDTSIVNATENGILASSAAEFLSFLNNTIVGSGTNPLILSAANIEQLDASSVFSPNGPDGNAPILLLEGTIDQDATLRLLDTDFVVQGDVRVEGGGAPELTVENGVTVQFAADSGIVVGEDAQGSIRVDGAGPDGVVFEGTLPVPGHWDGVTVDSQANDSVISGLTILHGGGNGRSNLFLNAQAGQAVDERAEVSLVDVNSSLSSQSGLFAQNIKLDVADSSFQDNLEHGAEILDVVFAESNFATTAFANNSRSGARISPQLVTLLNSATFNGNVFPIEITGGTVPDTATWIPLDEDYYITGVVNVEDVDSPILTLAAGTTLYHGAGGQLRIAVSDQGSLIADGTLAEPVVLSAITDFQGLPSNRGTYNGIEIGAFQRQSEIRHLSVLYAGRDGDRGAFSITGTHPNSLELDHLVLQFSGSHGLVSDTGPVLFVHDSIFSDNDDLGVILGDTVLEERAGQAPSFVDNRIENNGLNAMRLSSTDVGRVDTTNVFNNNNLVTGAADFLEVSGGTLARTATWFDHGIHFRISGNIVVGGPANPVWTLNPGVTVEFEADPTVGVSVGASDQLGGIRAIGTGEPITFTSAASIPARGDWKGVTLGEECDAASGNCVLDNVVIEYAGGEPDQGALYVTMRDPLFNPTPVVVQRTTIRDSGSSGVMIGFPNGIVTPTPAPGVLTPMFCEDLDLDGTCDNGGVVSDSPDYVVGYDHCYDPGNQTFGLTNLFCDNNDFNIFARNFANPYTPRTCEQSGLSSGPVACP